MASNWGKWTLRQNSNNPTMSFAQITLKHKSAKERPQFSSRQSQMPIPKTSSSQWMCPRGRHLQHKIKRRSTRNVAASRRLPRAKTRQLRRYSSDFRTGTPRAAWWAMLNKSSWSTVFSPTSVATFSLMTSSTRNASTTGKRRKHSSVSSMSSRRTFATITRWGTSCCSIEATRAQCPKTSRT